MTTTDLAVDRERFRELGEGRFEVTATTEHAGERRVMGVPHRGYPIGYAQFHPESVRTAAGHDVIVNVLAELG